MAVELTPMRSAFQLSPISASLQWSILVELRFGGTAGFACSVFDPVLLKAFRRLASIWRGDVMGERVRLGSGRCSYRIAPGRPHRTLELRRSADHRLSGRPLRQGASVAKVSAQSAADRY